MKLEKLKRRKFLELSSFGSLGLAMPVNLFQDIPNLFDFSDEQSDEIFYALLKNWCDGMLAVQIIDPANRLVHGALACPACSEEPTAPIHGRCLDAVFPFLFIADKTGEDKYLQAAIRVFEWGENVTMPDGSWTVVQNPTSWKGISVFGAIALAESLKYFGHLLDDQRKEQWTNRLQKVGEYMYANMDINFSAVNYSFTAIYGFLLVGEILENKMYTARSHEMAGQAKDFFTKNNLVFGEGIPRSRTSGKGLPPVDLGYNVEESLNGVVQYAVHTNDTELLELLDKALLSHLQFMLPDGGWDNSWGTRQFKWTYWGSRTSDGAQIAYSLMANRNPAFGLASLRNTELMQRCTANGLLHGGPHYISYGVKPCVHHTFTHAKALTTVLLHNKPYVPSSSHQLPREKENQKIFFEELDTWLISKGPWRATLTGYDFIYRKDAQQATGGALSILYHMELGLLMTGSMANYFEVEEYNQQPNPGEAFPLTPRIETILNGIWYTNLYDLKAKINVEDFGERMEGKAEVQLVDNQFLPLQKVASAFTITYSFFDDAVEFIFKKTDGLKMDANTCVVLPLVSPLGEEVLLEKPTMLTLKKEKRNVEITSSVPLTIDASKDERVFNMVPGVSAIPLRAHFGMKNEISITLKINK